MIHLDSPHPSSMPSHRNARRTRPCLISIGIALLALMVTWAVVLAYNVTENLPQCSDDGTSPAVMSCNWVNGQMSNAYWVEGSAVPQLIQISGLNLSGTSVHTYTWSVSWSDQKWYHGYDWLVSYDQARQLHQDYVGSPLNLNMCTSGTNAEKTVCNTLHTSGYSQTVDLPDDTYVSGAYVKNGAVLPRIQAFESKYGNRTLTLWSDAPIVGTSIITYYHADDSTGFPPIANGADNSTAGSTLVRYTIYFTSTGGSFMLEYGAHFALSGNPYVDPMAWGWDATHGGYGAAGIYPSGSWHVKDPLLDNGAGTIGSQDNQAKVQNPSLYPISSKATWNATTKRATDAITLTTSSNATINGTMAYWVCADTTVPYTDSLTNGCTSTTTATFVGNVAVAPSGKSATATSPQFAPAVSGRYCFLTIFTPAKNGNIYNFAPTADTNSTTECFDAFGPNAVTLSKLEANVADTGSPLAAILLGLAIIATGATLWKLKTRRQRSIS